MTPVIVSRSFGRGLAVFCVLAVALLTLLPFDGASEGDDRSRFGERFGSDVLGNVLFFVPLGVTLVLAGLRFGRAVAVAALVSAALELVQLAVPGRYGSPFDVLSNGLGGVFGAGLAATAPSWLAPSPRAAGRLVLGWSAALAGVFAATAALLAPIPSPLPLYGQWTANLGHLAWYRGAVRSATLGDMAIPPDRLADSPGAGALIAAGAPIDVRATAGPSISELAPLLSVFDEAAREVLLVGIEGDDLVVRRRTWAARLRLSQPELRAKGVLSGIGEGAPLHVRVWSEGGGTCVAANDRSCCGLGPSVGSGWAVVRYPRSMAPFGATLLDPAWMAALLLPLGYWSRRSRSTALAWTVALGGGAAATLGGGLMPPSWIVVSAGSVGALGGLWAARKVNRR